MFRKTLSTGCVLSLCFAFGSPSLGRAQTLLNQTVISPRMTSTTVPATPMVRTPSNLPTYMTSINYPLIYGSYAVFPYAAPPSFTSGGSLSSSLADISMRPTPVVTRAYAPSLAAPATAARVTVVAPRGAEVFFQGMLVPMSGTRKLFATPELNPLLTYTYDVQASWRDNGERISQSQRVLVRAGDDLTIAFPSTSPPPAAELPSPRPTVVRPAPEAMSPKPPEPVRPAPLTIPVPAPSDAPKP